EERKKLEAEFEAQHEELQAQIEKQAHEVAEQKYRLDLEAKDEELKRIQKKLEQLQKRTRLGSIELQGEALETYLKASLESVFPWDTITDVKKGQTGADLIHNIINPRGQRCGIIIWEAKNTKHWNDDWLTKIKED